MKFCDVYGVLNVIVIDICEIDSEVVMFGLFEMLDVIDG